MKNKLEKITYRELRNIMPSKDIKGFAIKENVFKVDYKKSLYSKNNDPLLGLEITLHSCDRAGVFNKRK